jgi:hypothetical protein
MGSPHHGAARRGNGGVSDSPTAANRWRAPVALFVIKMGKTSDLTRSWPHSEEGRRQQQLGGVRATNLSLDRGGGAVEVAVTGAQLRQH